jgi:hypothetical protein
MELGRCIGCKVSEQRLEGLQYGPTLVERKRVHW